MPIGANTSLHPRHPKRIDIPVSILPHEMERATSLVKDLFSLPFSRYSQPRGDVRHRQLRVDHYLCDLERLYLQPVMRFLRQPGDLRVGHVVAPLLCCSRALRVRRRVLRRREHVGVSEVRRQAAAVIRSELAWPDAHSQGEGQDYGVPRRAASSWSRRRESLNRDT